MDLSRRSQAPTCSVWKCWIVLFLSLALYQDGTVAFSVFAPHSKYICPEGHEVNLTCSIRGHRSHQHDMLSVHWAFTKDRNPGCTEEKHAKNTTENSHHKGDHFSNRLFYRTLVNITQSDSGGYCCFLYETNKKHLIHEAHGYMELQVKSDDPDLKACSLLSSEKDSDGTTAAAVAIVACIVGILCMPLILILVYKQRKAVTARRAQELVRMDSEAQGIENPVFDDPPAANSEQRPRLIFMSSRQQSDSGRHLLSEPNTPLSPPGPNDVFFPSLEPVPDSPDFV
ncbi:PREDICTED: V-type immunoglobulin domain-containing suppressor of T-cell activation [Nanorana parkeri]|uniref:V-type immunoglobulin domain-containing suppressor of T-cell activation n=1 Tax=Nanorana parkeri TaxID=125878 RepID=UPI0008548FC3|nr:PREDICTED: V-type immunoglobulin domain-containing suppressor of T-cell activation [Nanorana parkeri]